MGLVEPAPTFLLTWFSTAWRKVSASLLYLDVLFKCALYAMLTGCLSVLGVKEIDIAATLEHIRDQRPSMVRTKVCIQCFSMISACDCAC